MGDGLSPFELNRLARQRDDDSDAVRKGIERTARVPGEVREISNFGVNLELQPDGKSVLQIIKADGVQLHLNLNPEVRRLTLRKLEEHERDAPADARSSELLP